MRAAERAHAYGALLWVLASVTGCGDSAAAVAEERAGLGQPCSVELRCEDVLLCLEGRCVTRPFPPDAVAVDVISDVPADAADAASADAADTAQSDVISDATDGDAAGDVVADAQLDGDVGDGDAAPDATAFVLRVGDHMGVDDPSDDALTLQARQGPVAELLFPASGVITGLEVLLVNATGGASCGRYTPALWRPDAAGNISVVADWTGVTRDLLGTLDVQLVTFEAPPSVTAGLARVGLIFEGTCLGFPRQPLFVTDASGQLAATWLWAEIGASASWIPGATLSLSGRWAVTAVLEGAL